MTFLDNRGLTFNPELNILMNMTKVQKQGFILLLAPVMAYVGYKLALELWCIAYGLIY